MSNRKPTVLAVDDKKTIGLVLSVSLSSDFDVIFFDSACKAVQWLQNRNLPDVIVTDIHMPEMDGEELIRYLKGNEFFKSIPILVLSGDECTALRVQLLNEGVEDYVLKPFNTQELMARIKNILHRRHV